MAHYKSSSYSNSNYRTSPQSNPFYNTMNLKSNSIVTYNAIDLDISNLRSKYNKSKHERLITESEINLLKTKIKILTMEEQRISKSTEREIITSQAFKQIQNNKKSNQKMINNYKQKQEQYIKVKRNQVSNERKSSIEKQIALKQKLESQHKKDYSFIIQKKIDIEKWINKERNKTALYKKQKYLQFKAMKDENKEKRLQEKVRV